MHCCNICNSKTIEIVDENHFHEYQKYVCEGCLNVYIVKNNFYESLILYMLSRYRIFNESEAQLEKIRILLIDTNEFTQKLYFETFKNFINNLNKNIEVIIDINEGNGVYNMIYINNINNYTIQESMEMINNCKSLMSDNSIISIKSERFNKNVEYKEIKVFYNTNSMKRFAENCKMVLNNVVTDEKFNYIFEITKMESNENNIIETYYKEIDDNIYDINYYQK
jgi:hypothetical protein